MPTFSTLFTPPAAPGNLLIEADLSASVVTLSWDVSGIAAIDFANYTVYRSTDGGTVFSTVAVITDINSPTYSDFEAPLNVGLIYRVTQSDLDFESDPAEATASLDSPMWWVVTPDDESLTFPLTKITAAQLTSPKVQDVYSPIGRPTKVAVGDVVQTEDGSLTFRMMPDNPGMVALLKRIQARMEGSLILKAPDGVIHHVQYGDVQRSFTSIAGMQEITLNFTGVG